MAQLKPYFFSNGFHLLGKRDDFLIDIVSLGVVDPLDAFEVTM